MDTSVSVRVSLWVTPWPVSTQTKGDRVSADLLRRAAAKIRETAVATACEGGWYQGKRGLGFLTHNLDPYKEFDDGVPATAEHIALWSPVVADLVADVLIGEADAFDDREFPVRPQIFSLARRILGEDA